MHVQGGRGVLICVDRCIEPSTEASQALAYLQVFEASPDIHQPGASVLMHVNGAHICFRMPPAEPVVELFKKAQRGGVHIVQG